MFVFLLLDDVLMMRVLHLTASTFFGGPERVIVDIVQSQIDLGLGVESFIATFRENGCCEDFLLELRNRGLVGSVIERDVPHLLGALFDIIKLLRQQKIDLICAHGHKARFLGWLAARRVGIPIVGISHGWTWQDWKTKIYERIDQWIHHRLDKIVCVSQGQADKVIKSGTKPDRVTVIYNAIDINRFNHTSNQKQNNINNNTNANENNIDANAEVNVADMTYRLRLENYFDGLPKVLIGAAGRLSPEKGFDVLVDAVKILANEFERTGGVDNCEIKETNSNSNSNSDSNSSSDSESGEVQSRENSASIHVLLSFGLVLFGEGFLRGYLQSRIDDVGVAGYFKMVGFTRELDCYLPFFDIFVQSSWTEGFPCVNLEAMASGVPVVATEVGGVPEQIESGVTGILVPSGDSVAIARELKRLISEPALRKKIGTNGRESVTKKFTRTKLAKEYFSLFTTLLQN
ncbi:MAG: glycosyltransferase family 4 protein [Planctomycetaceae bacterium]|nr:glycosyltransferase family 4 protein [Planctomycetaceae bacterium]